MEILRRQVMWWRGSAKRSPRSPQAEFRKSGLPRPEGGWHPVSRSIRRHQSPRPLLLALQVGQAPTTTPSGHDSGGWHAYIPSLSFLHASLCYSCESRNPCLFVIIGGVSCNLERSERTPTEGYPPIYHVSPVTRTILFHPPSMDRQAPFVTVAVYHLRTPTSECA